jgi:hypothetical protein
MKQYTFALATARHTYGYASDSLREALAEHADTASAFPVVNLAYTDYGGEFFDIVVMDYFIKNHPENIITEKTCYFGRNAFLFGEPAARFLEETKKYTLGFDNLEEFYCECELAAYDKAFASFISDELTGFTFEKEAVLEHLQATKQGQCRMTTQGVDFSGHEWLKELTGAGLITKTEED